jgi:dTDP-4-amino-4,6-dideoxygalactose transaminase
VRGEAQPFARVFAPRHPDSAWLDLVVAAVEDWRTSPYTAPTSSLSGRGAISAFESAFSERVGGRDALLLPSATFALRLALQTLGVGPGDEVIVPVVDWPSSYDAVTSLGAVPVPVAVEPRTLTIDPTAVHRAAGRRSRAVVACHLHGEMADVDAVRAAAPGLPVVEDCAGALSSTLDGRDAGTLGDMAVFSFGPGKQISTGEGGMLVSATASLHHRAIGLSAHPLRAALQRIPAVEPVPGMLGMRGHPLSALLGLHLLTRWDAAAHTEAHAASARRLLERPEVRGLVSTSRRTSASAYVPCFTHDPALGSTSGAMVLPSTSSTMSAAHAALGSVRLVSVSRDPRDP